MRYLIFALMLFSAGCDFFSTDQTGDSMKSKIHTGGKSPMEIALSRSDVMLDESITIRIEGLTPAEQATLTAEARDDAGIIWQSVIQLPAPGASSLELAGVDPEGLFTRMVPLGSKKDGLTPLFEKTTLTPISYTIRCVSGGAMSQVRLKRHFIDEKLIVRRPVNEGALVGSLFYPRAGGPHPIILFLSGSGGKFNEPRAALLASKGFAVFSVAYFGVDPLPKELSEIPLEFFDRALVFLKSQSMINMTRMGIFGYSKGGELALLLASRHPGIKAVAAYSPSAYVWQGLARGRTIKSSWTSDGKPLAFVPMEIGAGTMIKLMLGRKVAFRRVYEDGLDGNKATADLARIPVENIRASVLITAGGADAVWPADIFAAKIEDTIKRHGGRVSIIQARSAGHLTTQAFLPPAQSMGNMLFGGDTKTTADLLAQAWSDTVSLFKKNL